MESLNILFINSIQMWGGAEIWLMDVMHGLIGKGHKVTLVCQPDTILEKNARKEGFDVVSVKMRSDFDPLVIMKIWRLMRKKNIHVLCTNMDKELRFGGIAAKLSEVKAVIPSREVDYPLKNKLRYRFTYNYLADYIIANSFSTKNTLLKNAPWLQADRIEVVYKGISPEPYLEAPDDRGKIRAEFGVGPEEHLVGFVGQIDERKCIKDIIRSIPAVLKELPDTKFLFAGKGNLEEYLLEQKSKPGLTDKIIYAGFRKDIPAIMKAIDLLILPSRVEGFGYVLIEAMAAAKPVVATNVSSIPEIVKNGETGLLVPVHKPEALAEAMLTILRDKNMAALMGKNGRDRMIGNFTIERMVTHIESIFLDFVNGVNKK
ncbi:glycosyltransferase family 4 protein [bacterium]|nr:glycosyltransferase family 4 protein [bacterium]